MKPIKPRLKLPLQPTDATNQSFKLQQPSRAVIEKANILVFSLLNLKPRDFIIISSSPPFSSRRGAGLRSPQAGRAYVKYSFLTV